MNLSRLFRVSTIAAALALTACGGDINVVPTVNDNSQDNSTNNSNNTTTTAPDQVDEVECASYSSEVGTVEGVKNGDDCIYSSSFAGGNISITQNITLAKLPNGGVHLFEQALQIGNDGQTSEGFVVPENGPTLTIEAGTTVAFDSGEAILRVARGANIQAIGTADEPIIFTSSKAFDRFDTAGQGPQYADWGGIIINGNGITDQCTDAERDASTCDVASEGIVSYYGGNDNNESSGNMEFVKIWYAGSGPRAGGGGDDLNSLTLNAVGSQSKFQFIHIHQGFDDGIETFGGAANLKYVVVTDTQDDSFDFDAGYQGKLQYLFVKHGTVNTRTGAVANMGNGGFEQDGAKNDNLRTSGDYTQAPVAKTVISNVTIITTDEKSVRDDDASVAMKFDDAYTSDFYNVLMIDPSEVNSACFSFSGDGHINASKITFNGAVAACPAVTSSATFDDPDADAAYAGAPIASWWDAQTNVQTLAAEANVLVADIHTNVGADTPITATAFDPSTLNDSFFTGGNFIGALSSEDTSSTWYNWVREAYDAAEQD